MSRTRKAKTGQARLFSIERHSSTAQLHLGYGSAISFGKQRKLYVSHAAISYLDSVGCLYMMQVLHAGRLGDIQRHHKETSIWLQQLQVRGNFACAPAGSNDDWYWMYAAVMAREKGMLVRHLAVASQLAGT